MDIEKERQEFEKLAKYHYDNLPLDWHPFQYHEGGYYENDETDYLWRGYLMAAEFRKNDGK